MRFLFVLLTAALAACAGIQSGNVLPERVFPYNPPSVYEQWLYEAKLCVAYFASVDSTFMLDSTNMRLSATDLGVWLAVPTEAYDGSFPFRRGRVFGAFFHADSTTPQRFYISAQLMMNPITVKHEMMHALVVKSTEFDRLHGMPWGLCEFNN